MCDVFLPLSVQENTSAQSLILTDSLPVKSVMWKSRFEMEIILCAYHSHYLIDITYSNVFFSPGHILLFLLYDPVIVVCSPICLCFLVSPRWSFSCPGDHNRIWKPAQLPPHSVERPSICSHHPVHPQMESGEYSPLPRTRHLPCTPHL